ncbi:hypothetical protein LTR66_000428 [Elasticomyces elasticus]|nr:hypothetical protein LTR66_000428 [Elasticomyces elasticus]
MHVASVLLVCCAAVINGFSRATFVSDEFTIRTYTPEVVSAPSPDVITDRVVGLQRRSSVLTVGSTYLRALRRIKPANGIYSRVTTPPEALLTPVEGGLIYIAPIQWGTQRFYSVIDTGSSDTWLAGTGFTCLDQANYSILPEGACGFASTYTPTSTFSQIQGYNFNITYLDGEFLNGIMGYESLSFAGINVPHQEVAVVNLAAWTGDGRSSGLIGLAYRTLTNAYPGANASQDVPGSSVRYDPLLTTMFNSGLTNSSMFSLAVSRDPYQGGYLAIGGLPPVPYSPHFARTPITVLSVDNYGTPVNNPVYQYYTININGFAYADRTSVQFNPLPTRNTLKLSLTNNNTLAVVDSGTSVVYLANELAAKINALFQPPATWNADYGSWEVGCGSKPPVFGVDISGKIFYVNPVDMIVQLKPSFCISGVQGNNGGFSILGDVWMRNVLAVFDVGAAEMRFAAREFYGLTW